MNKEIMYREYVLPRTELRPQLELHFCLEHRHFLGVSRKKISWDEHFGSTFSPLLSFQKQIEIVSPPKTQRAHSHANESFTAIPPV